jgi:hypothetical protein
VNSPASAITIRRILIALDASGSSLAALEAACALAARLEAELIGLFVEDVQLLRLAALPFAREVGVFSARRRPLGSVQMQRLLRAQAAWAQAALAAAAARRSLRWSFRVVRGEVTQSVLEAVTEADLLALGRARPPAWRADSTLRVILAAASRPVLLASPAAAVRAPVAVVYDGTAESGRALQLAQLLARRDSETLTVILLPRDAAAGERLQRQAAEALQGSGLAADFILLPDAGPGDVVEAVRRCAAGTLVVPADLRLKTLARDALLADLDCAVLLVR